MAYLADLATDLVRLGADIFTESRVIEVEDGQPCRVATALGDVLAKHIVLATHTPPNRLAYHTQIFAYRTYALAATSHTLPAPGLYFDTANPYHYLRTQDTPDGQVLIVGGQDHKTGKQNGDAVYLDDLEAYARDRFPRERVLCAWSGQIMEPSDRTPFIGYNGSDKRTSS